MNTTTLSLFCCAAVVLAGCSDSAKPVAKAPVPAQQPASAVTGTAAQAKAPEAAAPVYTYNTAGRRDPFTPIIIKEEKKALMGAKTPLERYPINEFKLTGIVWGGLGYMAMLEGPDGKGYFIRKGAVIGPNRGVVKKISENMIIVEERYKDPSGEPIKKEIIVELRKKREGTP